MSEPGSKEYNVEVDSKIVGLEPQDDDRLTEALASAGAQLVRLDLPRFVVRVKTSSEADAERQAVELSSDGLPGLAPAGMSAESQPGNARTAANAVFAPRAGGGVSVPDGKK